MLLTKVVKYFLYQQKLLGQKRNSFIYFCKPFMLPTLMFCNKKLFSMCLCLKWFFYFKCLFNKAATCVNLTKNVHQCAKSDNGLTSLCVQQVELEPNFPQSFLFFVALCLFPRIEQSPIYIFSVVHTHRNQATPYIRSRRRGWRQSDCTAKKLYNLWAGALSG